MIYIATLTSVTKGDYADCVCSLNILLLLLEKYGNCTLCVASLHFAPNSPARINTVIKLRSCELRYALILMDSSACISQKLFQRQHVISNYGDIIYFILFHILISILVISLNLLFSNRHQDILQFEKETNRQCLYRSRWTMLNVT